jgi:hypothetical protein
VIEDVIKSLKELQEFSIQRNDSDMLSVISQAKAIGESQAAWRVNCVQKTLLDYRQKMYCSFFLFSVMSACIQ